MNEAFQFACRITDALNSDKARDDGAKYRICITDQSGNVAEIQYNKEEKAWWCGQSFDRDAMLFRTSNRNDVANPTCGVCGNNVRKAIQAALERIKERQDKRRKSHHV